MPPHLKYVAFGKSEVQICDESRTRSTFSPSVIVSVGMSKLSLMDFVFVRPWVKIIGDILLSQQLLPVRWCTFIGCTVVLLSGQILPVKFIPDAHWSQARIKEFASGVLSLLSSFFFPSPPLFRPSLPLCPLRSRPFQYS